MEGILQQASIKGQCTIKGCDYRMGRRLRMLQHIESHFVLFVCSCGYFSSYRDTTTKHSRTRHHDEKSAVIQVDTDSYHVVLKFIAGPPEKAPSLPAWPKDLQQSCIPRCRETMLRDYILPRVTVAAVATNAVRSHRSVGDLVTAKILKGANTLMTRVEARQKRNEVCKRLSGTRNGIHHLNLLLASARSTEADDELILAAVDARLVDE